MADPARYTSLIKRQKEKLAYARKLAPRLAKGVDDYGPAPSFAAVAEWLQKKRIKPSADAQDGAKWVAQTVKDYLYMDGVEPSRDNIFDYEALSKAKKRDLGSRFAAFALLSKIEEKRALSDERLVYERDQLERHMTETVEVAKLLRMALKIAH